VREAPAQGAVGHGRHAAREGALGLEHHQRRTRHALDAAGDEQLALAAPDGLGGRVDGLESRAAQPVDGLAGHADGQAGQQQRHAGDVAIVLAGLVGAAQDDVVDTGRVDLGALQERADSLRRELVRPHAGQRPAIAPDRGAHVAGDDCLA
jgi:hypothetical protein